MNTFFSALLVLIVAVSTQAFAPAPSQARTTALNDFLSGKALDPSSNAYARGGKNSWEFELDTMYVEQKVTKAAPKKTVTKKKVTPAKKKAAPAKKKFFNF